MLVGNKSERVSPGWQERRVPVPVFQAGNCQRSSHQGADIGPPLGLRLREDQALQPGPDVLWLGRFDPTHKGLDLLVDAVRSLAPHERPRVRLHGPDRRGGKAR